MHCSLPVLFISLLRFLLVYWSCTGFSDSRMFLLTKPSQAFIQNFIDRCEDSEYSYAEVGFSITGSPLNYNTDHNRILIGHGQEDFEKAKTAIRSWKMFDMPWVELCWPDTPVSVGENVGILVDHFGFYSLNACRIVYLIDEITAMHRYGLCLRYVKGTRRNGRREVHGRISPRNRRGLVRPLCLLAAKSPARQDRLSDKPYAPKTVCRRLEKCDDPCCGSKLIPLHWIFSTAISRLHNEQASNESYLPLVDEVANETNTSAP